MIFVWPRSVEWLVWCPDCHDTHPFPTAAFSASGLEPPGPGAENGAVGSQSGPPVSHTTGAPPDSPDAPPTDT